MSINVIKCMFFRHSVLSGAFNTRINHISTDLTNSQVPVLPIGVAELRKLRARCHAVSATLSQISILSHLRCATIRIPSGVAPAEGFDCFPDV